MVQAFVGAIERRTVGKVQHRNERQDQHQRAEIDHLRDGHQHEDAGQRRAAEVGQPQRREVFAPDCERLGPSFERDRRRHQSGVEDEIEQGKKAQRHEDAANGARCVSQWSDVRAAIDAAAPDLPWRLLDLARLRSGDLQDDVAAVIVVRCASV